LVNLDLLEIKITESQQKYVNHFKPWSDYEKKHPARKAYTFVSKYVPGKGRYLDIGCGGGAVLYFFKKAGWEVKGLELSPVFADHVKKSLNVDVDVANFLDYNYSGEKYDLVSLRHVLEHLPDSILAMNKISGLLRENGYAHFEFPNIQSFTHRLQRFRNKFTLIRKQYKPGYTPGHCNEFSKGSFNYLLKETGFKLVRWETYSLKPFPDFIYNHFHFGTKARAIVQKIQ
jgi:2-polyprenyl-3-methyl-5-hydroxy-6-metoxy-1,4-benzoquinol methylase